MDPWEAEGTDENYFVPYTSLSRVENSIIDFDVDNIEEVLYPQHKADVHAITKRINSHYLNSIRHEKRAFGNKRVDDFQSYNWGLSLSVEMGLIADQTELLMAFYTTTMEDRLTEKEFETIIILHTNFKTIPNSVAQQRKWRDLKKSWKLLAVNIDGNPPTISKKDFMRSLDVNFIDFDVNIDRLSRDMQNVDYDAAYLHLLLLDDPVLRGEIPTPKKDFCSYPKSRRKGYHGQPRGGDSVSGESIASLFNDLLRREEEANNSNEEKRYEQEIASAELEDRLHKKRSADEDAKRRQVAKQIERQQQREEEKQLLIASETARRDLEGEAATSSSLAVRVRQIKQERRQERELQRKKDRAALVKATSSKPAAASAASATSSSLSLLAPDVSQASELKPPPLAYRPPSPPKILNKDRTPLKPKTQPGYMQKKAKPGREKRKGRGDDPEGKKARVQAQEQQEHADNEVQEKEKKKEKEKEREEEKEQELDDFVFEPCMDDDEYFLGEMAEASIEALLDGLYLPSFLDTLIRDTIQPPPPSAAEENEWRRKAAARKKEEERVRKEKAYIEGLCEEAVDLCVKRLGDEEVTKCLQGWQQENEAADEALRVLFEHVVGELLKNSVVEAHRELQSLEMQEAAIEDVLSTACEALLAWQVRTASKLQLTEEVTQEALSQFFEPFLESLVMERMDIAVTKKLNVDYTKFVMERKAAEGAARRLELQREKEAEEMHNKEAAEKKARQLAAKKEEEKRLKEEKKKQHLELLEQMEQKKKAKIKAAERAKRIAAGDLSEQEAAELEAAEQEAIEQKVTNQEGQNQGSEVELAESKNKKEDEVDENDANEKLFDVVYDIISDDVVQWLLHGCVNEAARGEENAHVPTLPQQQKQDDYEMKDEDEVAGLAVQLVEAALVEALLTEDAMRDTAHSVLAGDEEQDVCEAVQALLSDRLHLDMQRVLQQELAMSGGGSTSGLLEPPLTPVQFEVTSEVSQPSCFPSLQDLHQLPFTDYRFNVPKTNGQLRIHIRHDDEGESSGLFVHGFKAYSAAEEQGLLQVGDELLELNGVPMEGEGLLAVINALDGHHEEFVTVVVRRHEVQGGLCSGTITPRFSISSPLGGSLGRFDDTGSGGGGGGGDSSIASLASSGGTGMLGFLGPLDTSPRPFVVAQTQPPESFPPMETLLQLPSQELRFVVPKTNGQLRIELRHDDDGETNGIFIQGFRPFSEAKKQGLLRIGDELLELEGVDVCGRTLEDVIHVLSHHYGDDVEMLVCRRDHLDLEDLHKSAQHCSAPGSSRAGSSRRLPANFNEDLQWEDIDLDSESTEQQSLVVGEHGFSVSSFGSHNRQDNEDNGSLAASTNGLPDGDAQYTTDLQLNNSCSDTSQLSKDKHRSKNINGSNSKTRSPRKDMEAGMPYSEELEVEAPRTDNQLRVLIKRFHTSVGITTAAGATATEKTGTGLNTSSDTGGYGFYVDGFLPMCRAEGVLQVGDEVLVVDGTDVAGCSLKEVARLIASAVGPTVKFKVKRTRLRSTAGTGFAGAGVGREGYGFSSTPNTARSMSTRTATAAPALPAMHTYSEELELEAPRTDNQLRVLIKRFHTSVGITTAAGATATEKIGTGLNTSSRTTADTTDLSTGGYGFYVHGFLPMCRAEGVLQAGDEVLAVDGTDVAGCSLKEVARLIASAVGPTVKFKVKRSFTVQK